MKEIRLEIESLGDVFPSVKTLIVAEDDRTCHQLRQILECGSQEFLQKIFTKSNTSKDSVEKTEYVNTKLHVYLGPVITFSYIDSIGSAIPMWL